MKKFIQIVMAAMLVMVASVANAQNKDLKPNGNYRTDYNLYESIDDNPADWAKYEKDCNRWLNKWMHSNDDDTISSANLKSMVEDSVGMVAIDSGSVIKVYVLRYSKDEASPHGVLTTFSKDKTVAGKESRDKAYSKIFTNGCYVYGAAGIPGR